MKTVDIHAAKAHFLALVERAAACRHSRNRPIVSCLGSSRKALLLATLVLIPLALIGSAQDDGSTKQRIDLPRGHMGRVQSPDRRWTLVFESPDDSSERRLWIENTGSPGRRLVKAFTRSVSLSWAPDSSTFFVNDEWGSNGTDCYVFDPATLKSTDVTDLLAAHYPGIIADHRKPGHSYTEATRWLTSRVLLVTLTGHFDEPPAQGFTFRFQVDLNGNVRKIAESRKEEHW
jgi:hypothetical protein